jgi:hypothetical protein
MEVLAVYEAPHPNQARPAQQTGLYVGRDGMAQQQLTLAEVEWMKQHTGHEEMLANLAQQEARRSSLAFAYGREDSVLSLLFMALVILFLAIFLSLILRRLWKSKSNQD